jgi:transcription elongation factor S-II
VVDMGSNKKTEAQLVELFQKAVKAADKVEDEADKSEETRCVDALKAMKKVPVTTSILMDTQVGKQLRKLTKHQNSGISVIAQELIDAWKKIVATEAAAKNGSAAATAKKSPANDSLKSPGLSSPKSTTTVGKLVKTEHTVEVKTTVSVTTSQSQGNGALKPVVVKKCGDTTRDRIRELLAEAFSKVLTEAKDDYVRKVKATNVGEVAVTVEIAMFTKLGLSTGAANKGKYRSIMFNLKDPNNPDLRRRVLLGEIAPQELLTLSVEDMASDQRKKENQEIKDKALFECERGLKQAASTDQFKCSKCKQRKCTYFQMQTRSADEPMTTFVTCVNCNNHWKFC